MPPYDALGPVIEHLGVLIAAVASPLSGAVVVFLAIVINRQPLFLLAAASAGVSDAVLMAGAPTVSVGMAGACALGAAGALLQAWVVWPCARMGKRIARHIRSRVSA